jgi:flagellar basal-body rod modification protein FlgD
MVGFSWDEVPENIRAARTPVRVAIETVPGATSPADMFVYAKVIGVDMPQDTSEMTLRVEDYGLRSSLEVTSIR